MLAILAGLACAGCSGPADAPAPPEVDQERTARPGDDPVEALRIPNLNVSSGQPIHWQVDDWTGDVAFALAVVSGGPCQVGIDGMRTNDRGVGGLTHYGTGWVASFSLEPGAEAAGAGNDRPGAPTPVSASRSVERGGIARLWLGDLGPSPLGPTLQFDLACDQDSAVRLEAARRSVLTGGQDFSSDAAAMVPVIGVVVGGQLSLAFEHPASLLYACASSAGNCSLEAEGPQGQQSLSPDSRIQELQAGSYGFTLEAVTVASSTSPTSPLVFAIAEFQPVTTQEEFLALPAFG